MRGHRPKIVGKVYPKTPAKVSRTITPATGVLMSRLTSRSAVKPPSLVATTVSASTINVVATPPAGFALFRYNFELSVDGGETYVPWASQVGATLARTGLAEYTQVYFRASITDLQGNGSSYSTPVSARTLALAPTAPVLTATAVSASQINLSASGAASAAGIATYTFQVANAAGGPWTTLVTQASPDYPHTGLAASTTRFYRAFVTDTQAVPLSSTNSNVASATTTAAASARKFNPSWFMESNQFNSPENAEKQANIQGEITRLFQLPAGWGGYYIPFNWAFLEPTKGNYDFSAIVAMHNQLWAQGRRLGIAIALQNFQWVGVPPVGAARPSWWANRTLPDWLVTEGYAAAMANGHCARIWEPVCRNYYRDLVIAASNALDGLPGIEFFEGPETSFQVTGDSSFTQTNLHNSLMTFIGYRSQFFPTTPCIWGLNYAGSQSQALAQAGAAAANNWGCGGPDTNAGPPANTVPGAGQEIWGHMAWRGAGNDGTFNWGTTNLTGVGVTRCGIENNTIADMPDAGSAVLIERYMNNVMNAHYKVIKKVESAAWPSVGFDTGWVPAAALVAHRVNTTRPTNWP